MFGNYLEKGVFIEKLGLPSVPEAEPNTKPSNRYMLADMSSFFTLLVGIYFPSVTGQCAATFPTFHRSAQPWGQRSQLVGQSLN